MITVHMRWMLQNNKQPRGRSATRLSLQLCWAVLAATQLNQIIMSVMW